MQNPDLRQSDPLSVRGFWIMKVVVLTSIIAGTGVGYAQSTGWPQWGGPHRNFKADSKRLDRKMAK